MGRLGAQRLFRVALVACALLLAAVALPMPAFAEGIKQASIVVEQNYETDAAGARKTFSYVLEAETPGAPMPDGAEGATYTWTMTGDDSATITIPFETLPSSGYVYRAYQDEAAEDGYTFDGAVFTLKLLPAASSEAEDGAVIIAYDESGDKPGKVCWTVSYTKPPEPGPEPEPEPEPEPTPKPEPPTPDHGPNTGDPGVSPLMDIAIVAGVFLIILAFAFAPRKKGGSRA